MSFRCPQCLTRDSLVIAASLALPPDKRLDEITLQVVSCTVCVFRGLAVYEESRQGYLETDNWRHIGYWVSPDAAASVLEAIHACPEPMNTSCTCSSHHALRHKDLNGAWRGLVEMERGHTFLMRLAL